MGTPVIIVASGGFPVAISTNGLGMSCTESTNGYGLAVTEAPAGYGCPVIGITFAPDVTAPTITSSNAVSLAEGAALSHTLTANEMVTWTKTGGADTALFTLTGNTLSMTAKDFEAPADADANNTYVVQVTATDGASNATNQTVTVTVTNVVALVNTVAPVASGTQTVGYTLSCTPGTWTGSPTSYAYQWKRDGSSIGGAVAATYVLVAADDGTLVKCTVTATNAEGSLAADSNELTIGELPEATSGPVGLLFLMMGVR